MFSVHLRKFDELPYKTLLMVAAGLVILCQLAAMVFVADSQVAKAKLRDDQRRAELMAISQCMETRPGVARQNCIQQARTATASPPPAAESAPKEPAFAEASSATGSMMPAHPARSAQGLMAASFAIR